MPSPECDDLPCARSLRNLPLHRPSYIPLPSDCPLCRPRLGYRPQFFTWMAPLPPPLFAVYPAPCEPCEPCKPCEWAAFAPQR